MRTHLSPTALLTTAVALILTIAAPQSAAAAPSAEEQQRTHIAEIAETLDLHNAERTRNGLAPMVYSPTLATTYAQPYNDTLAAADSGLVHNDMGKLFWPGTTTVGENLAMATGSNATPSYLTKLWMNSSGHRANILNPKFSFMAVGWSVSPSGAHYVTVNFWGGAPENVGATYSKGSDLLAGASTSTDVNVYTTPGYHTVNGRQWRTTCEVYSQEPRFIERCRTEIWATIITYANGAYSQANGWAFNNLTYLPAPRSYWGTNPLAVTGEFVSGGREWKTSCADEWTGPNACRSFIKADVMTSYIDSSGTRRFKKLPDQWVFNNIVNFSS